MRQTCASNPWFLAFLLASACAGPAQIEPIPAPVPTATPSPRATSAAGALPRADVGPPVVLPSARPTAPAGLPSPLAPAAASRKPSPESIEGALGLPAGTLASFVGESGRETYDHLARSFPDTLAALERLAGGQERLITYFDEQDFLLPLIDVTPAGPGGSDVVLYDRTKPTVYIPNGLDTPADEVAALPPALDRYMYYIGNASGVSRLMRFDLLLQQVNTLPVANEGNPILFPSVGLLKRWVAFQEQTAAGPRLRLYDVKRDVKLVPAPMARQPCQVPRLDLLEQRVVFNAPGEDGRQRLYIYTIGTDRVETPPFLDGGGNASQACFSFDGNQLVYVSDRLGNPDLFLTDLRTGYTETLALANSPCTEAAPRFIGEDEIVYASDRSGRFEFYTYRLDTRRLEPLPVTRWLPSPPR